MTLAQHVIHKKQVKTKPPKHMVPEEGIKRFSLEALEVACDKYNVTLEEAIARFLAVDQSAAVAAKANPVHTMRDQATLAHKLLSKYEPDKKAVDVNANVNGSIEIAFDDDDDKL